MFHKHFVMTSSLQFPNFLAHRPYNSHRSAQNPQPKYLNMAPNYKTDLLVITSASGKQASHLLPLLIQKWIYIHLIVHTSFSRQRLQALYPSAEVLTADLTDPSECVYALEGATAVYHIGPSFHPKEAEIGINMIDAALHHCQRRKAQGELSISSTAQCCIVS